MDNQNVAIKEPTSERPPPRIGILGGTFDPIHEGHLLIAESARAFMRLDKVVFMPAGRPWLKSDSPVTDSAHRLAMVKLAVRDNPNFEVSDIEIERAGPTYTVDTLAELRRTAERRAQLYLILGMDSMRDLSRWRQPDRIFRLCSVIAVSRPGVADVPTRELERSFPSSKGKVFVIAGPMVDTSATDIRARVARKKPLDALPDSVRAYILQNALYGASQPQSGQMTRGECWNIQ